MYKRFLVVLILIGALAAFGFAGGQKEAETEGPLAVRENPQWPAEELGSMPSFSSLEGETVEISLVHFSDGQIEYLRTFAREFESLYPNIDLSIQIQKRPYDELYDSLATSLIGGQGVPDIVAMEISQTSKFFSDPFASEFRELNLTGQLEETLVKQAPYSDADGRLLGIENAGPHPSFLYYRKDLFDEAGIEMPLDTWQDFVDAGEKMKQELGYPITFFPVTATPPETWPHFMFAIQNGNPLYEGGEFVLNRQDAVQAMEAVRSMLYESEIAVDASPDDPLTQQRLVGQIPDQIAAVAAPTWYFGSRLLNKVQEPRWRVAPLPRVPQTDYRTTAWGGTALSVLSTDNEYPDVSEAFIKYTLSADNQLRKFEAVNYLPVVSTGLESERLENYKNPEVFGDQPVGELYAEYAAKLPPFSLGSTWTAVNSQGENVLSELKNETAEEWLQDLAEFEAQQRE